MRSSHLSFVCRALVLTAAASSVSACGDDSSSTTGGGGGGGTTTNAAATGSTTASATSGGATSGTTSSGSSGGGDGGSASVTTSVGTGGDGGGNATTTGTGGEGGNGTTTGTGGAGGSGGGTGSGGQGGTLDCSDIQSTDIPGDYCDAFAAGFCSQLETCINWFFVAFLGTEDECLLYAKQQCQYETLLPGQTATADELEACAELIVNAPCGCSADDVCGGVGDAGTLTDGSACEVRGQCSSGFCDKDGNACGQCQATVPVNGSCADNDAECGEDLYCDPSDDTCQPTKPAGSACVENYECGENFNNTFPKCADGECSLGLAEGEECMGDNDDACAFPLFCGIQTGTCDPIDINGAGGDCGYDLVGMQLSFCRGDFYCTATFTDELDGTCEPRKDVDDACTVVADGDPLDSNDQDCLPHLSCIGGACAVTPDVTCL